ncbi:MAG: DUF4834 family protein [Alistipes sp.]|nr:DUF4834 family protein [Alistipes sp.]
MNFLTKLLDSIVDFVKRMPLFVIVVLAIAIVAPSLLGYMFYALLALVVLAVLSFAIFAWRLRRVQRDMHEQFRRAGEQAGYRQYRRRSGNEGDVSIHATPAMPEKRVSDDVGEYVDFKEEKNNDK